MHPEIRVGFYGKRSLNLNDVNWNSK